MCGALATRCPSPSNTAQEKSSRSLMFTEEAVFWSVTPICSAIDMKRLLNTSSITGSASVPSAARFGAGVARVITMWFTAVTAACQPSSTTIVWCGSMIRAGPITVLPGVRPSRRCTPASCQPPE